MIDSLLVALALRGAGTLESRLVNALTSVAGDCPRDGRSDGSSVISSGSQFIPRQTARRGTTFVDRETACIFFNCRNL